MKVSVLCFAQLKEVVDSDRVDLELRPEATVADLRIAFIQQFPAVEGIVRQLLIAVNGEYAADGVTIPDGSEVACFPPVSGG